jgi:histidine phosphotransfer protein HptB
MFPTEKIHSEAVKASIPETFRAAVDLSVLASYEDIQIEGAPDLIVELIDLYVKDAPRRVAIMRAALANQNWLALKREAHGLRGSSGNLGVLRVKVICDEIEAIDTRDLAPRAAVLLADLERELEGVLCVFLAERERRLQ